MSEAIVTPEDKWTQMHLTYRREALYDRDFVAEELAAACLIFRDAAWAVGLYPWRSHGNLGVSESFKYRSLDKKGLRERAKQAEAIGFGGVSEYDLARSGFKPVDDTTVEQGFRVKHNGTPEIHFYVIGTFKKDADGEWRLVTFKLFDPVNLNDEKEVPGL